MTDRILEGVAQIASSLYMRSDARRTLQQRILPALARDPALQRILFVGCAWYTWSYWRRFPGKDFWTIEWRPQASRWFGGPRAVADSVCRLDRHFGPASFDAIICNGVLGWGINRPDEAEAMFDQFARALVPGGLLVLGWTNAEAHRPVDVDATLARPPFEPDVFPALGSARHVTKNALPHVFSFSRTQLAR